MMSNKFGGTLNFDSSVVQQSMAARLTPPATLYPGEQIDRLLVSWKCTHTHTSTSRSPKKERESFIRTPLALSLFLPTVCDIVHLNISDSTRIAIKSFEHWMHSCRTNNVHNSGFAIRFPVNFILVDSFFSHLTREKFRRMPFKIPSRTINT